MRAQDKGCCHLLDDSSCPSGCWMPLVQWMLSGRQESAARRPSLPLVLFPQTSLCPVFQLCSFQSHGQPVGSFATAHESICILMLGHLSLRAKWVTRCNAQSSAYYNDLSLLVFSEPPLGGAIMHSCVFLVYTNIPSQPMYEPNLGSCLYQLVIGGKLWSHSCKLL